MSLTVFKYILQENDLFRVRGFRPFVDNGAFVAHRKGMTVKVSPCVRQAYAEAMLEQEKSDSNKDVREFYLPAYHGLKPDGSPLDCFDTKRETPDLSFLLEQTDSDSAAKPFKKENQQAMTLH